MKTTHPWLVALALVAPLFACGSDPSPSSLPGSNQPPAPVAGPPGSPPPPPQSLPAAGPTAKSLFLTGAEPLLRPTCNGCHETGNSGAPVFLGATPEASYAKITSNAVPGLVAAPANSKLLSHGAHLGPALAKAQVDAVTIWLLAEAKERGLDVKPATTETDALTAFAACMRFQDFGDGSGTGGLPGKGGLPGVPGLGGSTFADLADAETDDQGACRGCHNTGDGTFWASSGLLAGVDMTKVMFDRTKESPYILKLVKGTSDANGTFVDLVASDAIAKQSAVAAACVGPGCHPKFTLSDTQTQAIHDFVDATLQRWRNKQCTQPSDAGAD